MQRKQNLARNQCNAQIWFGNLYNAHFHSRRKAVQAAAGPRQCLKCRYTPLETFNSLVKFVAKSIWVVIHLNIQHFGEICCQKIFGSQHLIVLYQCLQGRQTLEEVFFATSKSLQSTNNILIKSVLKIKTKYLGPNV